MDFRERLTYVLDKKKASRPWLATAAKIPLGTINGWYNKGRVPKLAHVTKIAEALGVSIDYLVTGRVLETIDDPDLEDMCNLLRSLSRDQLMMAKGALLMMQYPAMQPKKERAAGNG